MRDLHKWKDKAEFSLDNRQIFFLFFGLSVVGCFIFALGIMTGRRLDFTPQGQMATIPSSSLDLLDNVEAQETYAFEAGIQQSTAEGLPPTRGPDVPPRNEKEVKAEKKVARALASAEKKKAQRKESRAVGARKKAAETRAAAAGKALASVDAASAAKRIKIKGSSKRQAKKARIFTLQMKAFSHEEQAEKMADKLRRNGHDIRVERAIVKGQSWHRVRLGHFPSYESALAAKKQFEKSEHIIAYAVAE